MIKPNALAIVIITALTLACAASFLVYRYLAKQETNQRSGVAAVVAASDIPVGAKLDALNLKKSVWPKENLHQQGYFSDINKTIGRVAVRQISAGDIITEQKLMPLNRAEMGGVMTYIVPQGHRAVTVAVNEVAGVAGFITPSSRVDIVLTTTLPAAANPLDDQLSKIILQNVPVLATGQVTEQKDGKPVIVPTVTLDLVPTDAEKLIVSSKKGSLQLLLRNVIDTAAITSDGMTVGKVLDGAKVHDEKKSSTSGSRGHKTYVRQPLPSQPKVVMEIVQISSKGKDASHTVYKLH